MKNKLILNKVVVKKSIVHGYGVFAEKDIKAGEIIEECHTIITKQRDTSFVNYYFFAEEKDQFAIPLGFGCIYNHSVKPNATYYYDSENKIMKFIAVNFINKGEEIYTTYGRHWFKNRNLAEINPNKIKYRKLFLMIRVIVVVTSIGCLSEFLRTFII